MNEKKDQESGQDSAGVLPSDPTADIGTRALPQEPSSEEGPTTGAVAFEAGPLSLERGTRIGPYKILQEIGEGGFGSVYMAEQDKPVRRMVALKVIKLGMDTRDVVARFEAERQALAMMDHPNIAKVLDAGATDAGRPYFVMELVKGVPIMEYCDTNRLKTRERLELFISVCRALQHAHQKGVIHRDIKPSNILITLHDGKPVPKVIDFGIAKATNARLTEKTLFTEFRQLIGTPVYMSPEQADMSGLDVDTRSDIYSLGVLLYELLTSTTPFDPGTLLKRGYAEIQRVIREEEPPKPSTRLSSMEREGITEVAKHRQVDPNGLRKLLRGDLDWIVMKALEKDRTRRYETAAGFAIDIERHLRDEPVAARPPSSAYRLRKFIRRNKVGVLTASLVLVALLLGLVVATFGLIEARRSAESARAEAEKATTVVELLQGMFSAADPSQVKGLNYTVRELLDDFSRDLPRKLAAEPEVEVKLRITIGNAYRGLGQYEKAEGHLEIALDVSRNLFGEEHPTTLSALNSRAQLYADRGNASQGEELLTKSLEISIRTLGDEHPITQAAMNGLGELLGQKGQVSRAEELLSRVFEVRRRLLGEAHPDTIDSMNNLANMYMELGHLQESKKLLVEALETSKRVLGETHPLTLLSMSNLAMFYDAADPQKAAPLLQEALEIQKKVLGEDHPDTLMTMVGLAIVYRRRLGRLSEAETLLKKTLAMQREKLGHEHPDTLTSKRNLAAIYRDKRLYSQAERLYLEVLEVRKRKLGEEHPQTTNTMNSLALLYWDRGEFSKAQPLLEKSYEMKLKTVGKESPETLISKANLAGLYRSQGNLEEARALSEEILETSRRIFSENDPHLAAALSSLGRVLIDEKKPAEAEPLLRKNLEIQMENYPEGHIRIAAGKYILGISLMDQGKFEEAEPLLLDANQVFTHPTSRKRILESIIKLYQQWGKPEKAKEWEAKLKAEKQGEVS